ncbi:hypothetical protein SAMN06265379_103464 [Saccharicrinis carchari]|uniref:Uncharacterized protein n=1 Tax=Saccharicrinis carchari TaxID=1168039 RepID=A0A521CTB1_SACCC|nr:hypothetical protein SAMN06265379_103464 [Saccharicrinis carchari]
MKRRKDTRERSWDKTEFDLVFYTLSVQNIKKPHRPIRSLLSYILIVIINFITFV